LSGSYADASALVKLVAAEPEGPALRDRLAAQEHVVTSVVGALEVVRVGRRARGPDGAWGGAAAFYCCGRRLCEAAASAGLPVESPGA
jgi:uncharacterized protein with PIN domain